MKTIITNYEIDCQETIDTFEDSFEFRNYEIFVDFNKMLEKTKLNDKISEKKFLKVNNLIITKDKEELLNWDKSSNKMCTIDISDRFLNKLVNKKSAIIDHDIADFLCDLNEKLWISLAGDRFSSSYEDQYIDEDKYSIEDACFRVSSNNPYSRIISQLPYFRKEDLLKFHKEGWRSCLTHPNNFCNYFVKLPKEILQDGDGKYLKKELEPTHSVNNDYYYELPENINALVAKNSTSRSADIIKCHTLKIFEWYNGWYISSIVELPVEEAIKKNRLYSGWSV